MAAHRQHLAHVSPEDKPLVSIVIACRNEARSIARLLDSLARQDLQDMAWEVVIADGMSDDGTREALEEFQSRDSRIRVIPNPGKIVSTGLNAAIRAAQGEVIIRMDAHTEYAPDYVRQCLDALIQTGADNVGGPARTRSSGYWGRAIAAGYASPFSCGGARFHDCSYEGYVDTVTYGCWRKETLLTLGLFDERLIRNQDDELNLRLRRRGGAIWQTPKIRSWYQPRERLSRLFAQYCQYGFWKLAVVRKHRIPASWRHLVPALFVSVNLALPLVAIMSNAALRYDVLAVWIALLGIYSTLLVTASFLALRGNKWDILPALPVVFCVYHLSYGFGFLCGLLFWPLSGRGFVKGSRSFTNITR